MPTPTGSTVIPTLRYRDAHAATDWPCNAFILCAPWAPPPGDGIGAA